MPGSNNTIGDARTMSPNDETVLVDRYRILRKIGQGGMGSVYLAEDLKLDNRKTAIKTIPEILFSSERAIRNLKREAVVAMELAHPNIVTLRGFEHTPDVAFLIMDYVEGQTLEQLLVKEEKLSEQRTRAILRPLAEALDYAHTKGIVHRDVKPSNIIISPDGTPYIMDFGIAREIKDTFTRVTGKSTSGTLPYMSPEQLRGEAPAAAQDIYSLAATAYECLTGNPPFFRGQIDYQVVHEEPPPIEPATRFTTQVISALDKSSERRPKKAHQIFVKSTPVQHPTAARTPNPSRKPPPTHRPSAPVAQPQPPPRKKSPPARPRIIEMPETEGALTARLRHYRRRARHHGLLLLVCVVTTAGLAVWISAASTQEDAAVVVFTGGCIAVPFFFCYWLAMTSNVRQLKRRIRTNRNIVDDPTDETSSADPKAPTRQEAKRGRHRTGAKN